MRSKLLSGLAVFAISVLLLAVPAYARVPTRVPNGQAGKSNVAHLYLFEKDPSTWDIVENGAWGKMKYNLAGPTFDFVFNGHGLEPGQKYTLIYYPDPWPGEGLICLGNGTANRGGNVHIAGSVDTGDLPAPYDLNANPETTTHPEGKTGAKIWLVLSSDIDFTDEKMIGWHPTEYLFEYDLINFNDTDSEGGGDGAVL